MFEEWCKTFDPEQHKGEISELLVNVPEIRALYARLVGIWKLFYCFISTGVCTERRIIHKLCSVSSAKQ